jgi:multiple sugar transport system permease protein
MNYLKRDARQLQLLLLPCVLLIGGLVVWPAVYSIFLSLTNASLVGVAATHPRFVGERNYMRLFADGSFWNSLVVTFWFVPICPGASFGRSAPSADSLQNFFQLDHPITERRA